jgi:hypothetical protein
MWRLRVVKDISAVLPAPLLRISISLLFFWWDWLAARILYAIYVMMLAVWLVW